MLAVIFNEMRAFFRNGSSLFFCIFFPSILLFFLGTFLEKVEVSDEVVGNLTLAYSVDFGDSDAASSLEEFIRNLEQNEVVTAEKISGDEIDGALLDTYSAVVELNGSDVLIYGGTSEVQNRTVRALFESYYQEARSYMAIAAVNPAALTTVTIASDSSFVEEKDLGVNRSMMDYYAVTMIVMIVFMGSCIGGASAFSTERQYQTMRRLALSPVNRTVVYFGKIIGSLPMALIQIVTVMFVATVFYDAHYCTDIRGNLLLAAMLLCASLAILSVGVLFNLLFPKLPTMPILTPILWAVLFYSGSFAKGIYIEGFSDKLPPYVIQEAAFDLTVFGRTEKAVHVTIASLILFAVLLIIGVVRVNIRRENT